MTTRVLILFCIALWHVTSAQETCNANEELDLRLVQTETLTTLNAGRLEICRGGLWGSIRSSSLTSFWPQKNTQVACLQLDFPGALNTVPPAQLTIGERLSAPGPVHYSDVSCDGTEESLIDCENSLSTSTDHSTDVYIVCSPGNILYSDLHTTLTSSGTEGDLQLVGSEENGRGAVEILTNSGWSTICPDSSWTAADATAVCQNLGYETGQPEIFSLIPTQVYPRIVSGAECQTARQTTSVELSLTRIGAGSCTFQDTPCAAPEGEFAGVSCSTRTQSQDRSLRRTRTGIVEILFDNRWGVICSPSAPSEEIADEICVTFGFDRGFSSIINIDRATLQGTESRLKPLWISDVSCPDGECRFSRPVGFGDCSERRIFAVSCGTDTSLQPGAIAGIVISVLLVVGITIAILVNIEKIKAKWRNRHRDQRYQTLVNPSKWCCCVKARTFRVNRARNREARNRARNEARNQAQNAPAAATAAAAIISPTPTPITTITVAPANPPPQEEPTGDDTSELTKAPPPAYNTVGNFQSPSENHPPPYSAYPPPVPGGGPAYPPPTLYGSDPAYPPPTLYGSDPVYPPPGCDPAYPPPGSDPHPPV